MYGQVASSLDPVRYSVEAEKYRAAAGYMASTAGLSSHNLYHGAPVDPVSAAAAKYLETSKNYDTTKNFLPESLLNKGLVDNYAAAAAAASKTFTDPNNGDGSAASKAYLETAKLYMDSKNYAAEVQRAYMDAAAKSYAEKCQESNNDGLDMKHERNDIATSNAPSVNFASAGQMPYYGQPGQPGNSVPSIPGLPGLVSQTTNAAQPLPGIVPLSLSQYASPTGTYPPSGEYRRPLPVIF